MPSDPTEDPRLGNQRPVLGSPFEGRLRELLGQVAEGEVSAEEATRRLRDLPFADLGFAKVDHHRELRQGWCEIVFGERKSPEQVAGIVRQLLAGNQGPILVTRSSPRQREVVRELASQAGLPVDERPQSRTVAILRNVPAPTGRVLVVTAGTSDLPVAEESVLTATLMGAGVELVADIGVAGMHRLGAIRDRLPEADAVVVMEGMEGALASVVGGMATC